MPHVVAALDTGIHGDKVLKRLPRVLNDDDLTVLAAVIPDIDTGFGPLLNDKTTVEEQRLRLEEAGRYLRDRGIGFITSVTEGEPAGVLMELAEKLEARLVVVPSIAPMMEKGRGAGYLSKKLEERCPVPVLVVS